jgi:hypothetical protein
MVAHVNNLITPKTETGGSTLVPGQPCLQSEFQGTKNNTEKLYLYESQSPPIIIIIIIIINSIKMFYTICYFV